MQSCTARRTSLGSTRRRKLAPSNGIDRQGCKGPVGGSTRCVAWVFQEASNSSNVIAPGRTYSLSSSYLNSVIGGSSDTRQTSLSTLAAEIYPPSLCPQLPRDKRCPSGDTLWHTDQQRRARECRALPACQSYTYTLEAKDTVHKVLLTLTFGNLVQSGPSQLPHRPRLESRSA